MAIRGSRIARVFVLRVKWRITIALALALLAAMGVFMAVSAARQREKTPSLAITQGGHLVANVGYDALERMGGSPLEYGGVLYSAAPLDDILGRAGAAPTLYETAVCSGGGGSITLQGADLLENGSAHILFLREGKKITAKQGGPFMLLFAREGETPELIEHFDAVAVILQE